MSVEVILVSFMVQYDIALFGMSPDLRAGIVRLLLIHTRRWTPQGMSYFGVNFGVVAAKIDGLWILEVWNFDHTH